MIVAVHNPARPKRAKKTKRTAARRRRNEDTMAKKKKKASGKTRKNPKRSSARRTTKRRKRNPASAAANPYPKRRGKRRSSKRRNPSHHGHKGHRRHKRRRNPSLLKHPAVISTLAAGAGVLAAVVVGIAGKVIAPNSTAAQLGVAGAGLVSGALVATKQPAIGGAIAAGSLGAVVTPLLEEKVLLMLAKSKAAPGGNVAGVYEIGRVYDQIGMVHERRPRLAGFNPDAPLYAARTPFGAVTA